LAGSSVVSCVNDFQRYNSCVRSSFEEEQRTGTVELIPVDNISNRLSAPAALNCGLKRTAGRIIVFCHQDVIFPQGWIGRLYEQISIVEKTHKNWGVLGTFGVAKNGMLAGHIVDYCGVRFHCPPLPTPVQSLDELCLIVRKDSGLAFDEDLGGFHFYGADICLEALTKGLTNFAVDACVQHLGSGKIDVSFDEAASKLYKKWRKKKPPLSVIETTCKVCRLQSGLKGIIAYKIARSRRTRRLKRARRLREAGMEYRSLRHDSI